VTILTQPSVTPYLPDLSLAQIKALIEPVTLIYGRITRFSTPIIHLHHPVTIKAAK